ncbi:MAG: hypothetical protein ACYC6M_03025 [Terriglobales bacterium]
MTTQPPLTIFTCPDCEATHTRGWFGAPGNFRCLRCGYTGPTLTEYHPDPAINAEVLADVRAGQQFNLDHGMSP